MLNRSSSSKRTKRKSIIYKKYTTKEIGEFLINVIDENDLFVDSILKIKAEAKRIPLSTARSWLKTCQIKAASKGLTIKNYAKLLMEHDQKRKIGVGRKLSYERDCDNKILYEAILKREEDKTSFTLNTIKNCGKNVIESWNNRVQSDFKGSDGWAKKFCQRHEFKMHDKFACPKNIPQETKKQTSRNHQQRLENIVKQTVVESKVSDPHHTALQTRTGVV